MREGDGEPPDRTEHQTNGGRRDDAATSRRSNMHIFDAARGTDAERERYVKREALLYALNLLPVCTFTGTPVRPDNAVVMILAVDSSADAVSVFHASVWDLIATHAQEVAARTGAKALILDGRQLRTPATS
ncbi:hypothetical protein [Micromonospora sp. NPDC048063]|uniref:hypothetical protein n=1 Tax=Micromonospora sp. NPDC048063 TaxID=3364256 RepID=UPI0037238E1E